MLKLSIVAVALLVFVTLLHVLSRRAVMLVICLAHRLPRTVLDSEIWQRSQTTRTQLTNRYPAIIGFMRERIALRQFSGLPLTLIAAAIIYVALLFSGLAEEVLEAEGIIRIDNIINALFQPWRVDPLISAFLWITALGSSPAIVGAVIIATGFI
jgi:hypothetical protein